MKPPTFNFKFLRQIFSLSLERVLSFSWWMVLIILLVLLFADGLIFYQYGLGFAAVPPGAGDSAVFRLREDTIRSAASEIVQRQTQFQTASTTPQSRNPFR